MNKQLRKAVQNAETKLNDSICAIQIIHRYLKFVRFGQDEPCVSACNGDEIILEYFGREIPIERAIEIMENKGYITPDDFL